MKKSVFWSAASLFAAWTFPAAAQISDDIVKIGVATDMASLYADINGPGAVVATQMAIDDFGGTILGIVLSFGTRWAMLHIAPASLPQAVVPGWWPLAGMIAVGGALLGSIYPGVMAVRQDPIEALAYE